MGGGVKLRKESSLIRLTFSYHGKRYDVYGKTEKELERKKRKKIAQIKEAEKKPDSSILLKTWANECIDVYKSNLSYRTYDNYSYALDHYILKDLGNYRLNEIKPLDCQRCLNKLKGLSKFTIGHTYQIMNFVFQKAVENDLLSKNPASNITKPKGNSYKHRRALNVYEEKVFLNSVKQHPHKLVFLLMYDCGCRPSEARRVEGQDFFDRNGKLYLHIRGTKTENADRKVPVSDLVAEALPEHLIDNKAVCLNQYGLPLNEQSLKRAWDSLKRIMNIEMGCRVYRNQLMPPFPLSKDICMYCLRHTYCTNLQKKGVDIRTAQYLMGHADIQMTANIYTHTSLDFLDSQYDMITKNVVKSTT